jgi:hypothetical protein
MITMSKRLHEITLEQHKNESLEAKRNSVAVKLVMGLFPCTKIKLAQE